MNSARPNAWVHAWDLLVWVGVVFPFLTGGVWLERPGFFVELSDLGIPVLVTGSLGWLLRRVFGQPIESASAIRFFGALWDRWARETEARPARALGAAWLLVSSIWALTALRQHWALETHSFDLALFFNTLWNLLHGNGYVSAVKDGINLFADHQSPILWLFAPLVAVVPRPEALLIAQSLGLASGALALHWLGTQYLKRGDWALAALPLLYWAYLPLRNANTFDFHPEVMMLPLFLAAIAGLQSRRFRWAGAFALVLALGGKESAGPVACGIGLSWALGAGPEETRAFTRRLGLGLIALGAAVFYFDVRVVPKLLGRQYAYQGLYSRYGEGLSDLLLSPVLKPGVFWPKVLGAKPRSFLFWMLAPLGFLPLLSWRAFIAAIPGFLMLFLSEEERRITIGFHYGIEPGVGLFWALPVALAIAGSRIGAGAFRAISLPWWALFWALGAFGRSDLYKIRIFEPAAHARWVRDEALPCIAPELALSATDSLTPQLSARHWAHPLPSLEMPGGARVSCVIDDPAIRDWLMNGEQRAALLASLPALGYRREYECGTFSVWAAHGASCMVCRPDCP